MVSIRLSYITFSIPVPLSLRIDLASDFFAGRSRLRLFLIFSRTLATEIKSGLPEAIQTAAPYLSKRTWQEKLYRFTPDCSADHVSHAALYPAPSSKDGRG